MATPHGVVTLELLARRSTERPGPPKLELLARRPAERSGPLTWGSSSELFEEKLPLHLCLNYHPTSAEQTAWLSSLALRLRPPFPSSSKRSAEVAHPLRPPFGFLHLP